MARRSNLDKQLDELAARFTPQIKSAFLTSVRDIKDTAILQGVIDAIQVGDLEAAFRATGLSPAAMRPITSMIERAFETGGVMVANSAPRGITDNLGNRAVFRFDVRNSRAERWLRDHSSNLVTRITEDTKTNIRSIVEAGVRDGRNPRNIALDIVGRVNPDTGRRSGGVVGLTRPQEQWVQNARQQLVDLDPAYFNREARDKRFDSIVRKAIKDGKPLSSEKINAITDKYSDNLLLQRGETIARTEAIQSLNKSADEAFQQAIDEGVLDRDAVTKVWDNSGDNRVRDSHVAMEGQTVKMNEPFVTPDGAMLMFPGDTSLGAPGSEVINCRCRVRHEVDWFADLENDDPPAPEPEVLPEPPPPAPAPPPALPPAPEILPEPTPPPGFAYEQFEPLPTVAAAVDWMKANVAKTVEMSRGVKLDGVNAIARATLEVNERFDLPPVRFIGDPAKDAYKWKFPGRAQAAYGKSYDAYLFKNLATDQVKLDEQAAYGQSAAFSAKELAIAQGVMRDSRFVDPEVKERFKRMTDRFWSVSPGVREVAYHELGHRFDAFNYFELKGVTPPIQSGWHYLVGKYAATNNAEYIAETFSLYMQGDESQFYRIYPPLLRFYQSKDKKYVSN